MSDLFLDILNRSIAAGWVVLAVILARFLLRRAPKKYTTALWAIVGARLLYIDLPQAPFSLIPSTQTITPESLFDRAPVITSGVEAIDRIVNPIYTESFRANEFASANPLQIWTAVAANLWLLGMVVIWLWAFVSWLRLRRRVAASVCLQDHIYICDAIDTPFILGMFRPGIYLPSTLTEEQQRHVIAHEEAHLLRFDHCWKPIAWFLLSVNWFNPLLWAAYILLCRDIELACDERVIADMTAGDKKGYSTTLLECSVHRHMIAACPLAFGEVGVKERVKAVLSYKKPAFWVTLIAVTVCVVLAVCFVTDPVSAQPEIRYNGYLYIQAGEAVDQLPDSIQSNGELKSTLHDSTPHPMQDGQSVGLDWEYAGQPLYQAGNVLYLEEPGGKSWLKFRLVAPHEFLEDTLNLITDYAVMVDGGQVTDWETLPDTRKAALRQILDGLQNTEFETVRNGLDQEVLLQIAYLEDGVTYGFNLRLCTDDTWMLLIHGTEFSQQVWTFRDAALSEWAKPYLDRAAYDNAIFSGKSASVAYRTYENKSYALTIGLPDGWRSELSSESHFDGVAFRFWPEDAEGFIQVQYENSAFYDSSIVADIREHTFPNGITAKRYERTNGEWTHFRFDTTQGDLYAIRQSTLTWTEEQVETALDILSTLYAYADGTDILGIHPTDEHAVLEATILEIHDGYYLVQPVDGSSPDRIEVPMENVEPSPEPEVGDIIRVEYDGSLMETYPARIGKVSHISVISGSVPKMVNIEGIVYAETREVITAEIDPSAILGKLHTQVEGLPANHGQGNFDCAGCQYARFEGQYAVLIDNEWVRFAEVVRTSPEYYLTIGAEGAVSIEIRTGSRVQVLSKPDLSAFEMGESILLPVLTGRENLLGVTITVRDADNQDIFGVTINTKEHGAADGVIRSGKWIIQPDPLGIHLSVEDPSPTGLTLVTNQDGTLWNSICTGANFSIARWDGTEWVFLPQREGTAWTMEAYGVPLNETTRTGINWQWVYGTLERGTYRIYKSYSGERGFLADREKVEQSCFAEFTIE